MCLTSTITPYVLPCGHAICLNDLTQLRIPVEKPGKPSRRLAKIRAKAKILASKCAPFMVLAFALMDPGAPAQWLYMAAGMLSGRFDSLCNDPCYARSEADNHICQHDCDCDGARTCSFFGFCVGHSGECTAAVGAAQKAWQLQASAPGSSGVYSSEHGPYRIAINSSSAFNASWLELRPAAAHPGAAIPIRKPNPNRNPNRNPNPNANPTANPNPGVLHAGLVAVRRLLLRSTPAWTPTPPLPPTQTATSTPTPT